MSFWRSPNSICFSKASSSTKRCRVAADKRVTKPRWAALTALAVTSQVRAQVQLPSGPPYTTVSATGNSLSVAIGDMNGDGNQDVVIGLYQSQNIQVVPGDGQGGFGAPVISPGFPSSIAARPRGIVLGDVNGDGKLDAVAFDAANTGALSVLFGDGARNLGSPTVYNFNHPNVIDPHYVVWSAALADVNHDGKPDLIVAAANNFFSSVGDVWVLLNDGSGNFIAPATYVWTRTMGHGDVPAQLVAAGDLDGDGNCDIVVTSGFGQFGSGNVVTILSGNGTGAFTPTLGLPFPLTPNGRANLAQGVVIADMNGDTLPDLVVSASDIGGTRTGGVTVFRNTGARTFDAGTTYSTPFFRDGMVAVGDLNGDGRPDVVVTGANSGDSIAYLLNTGNGGLGAGVFVGGLGGAFGLALGDLTHSGPGTLDIVVGTTGAGTKLLRNGPPGPVDTTPPVITSPGNITAEATGSSGAVVNFTATAQDNVDGPVNVTASPPSGSTFPLGVTPVGLSASDAAHNTATASFTVTVRDTTPPVILAPTTATAEATSAAGTPVTFVATASDLVSGNVPVIANPPSATTIQIGFSSVSLSATDAAGNTASGSILINVRDTTAPALTVPANQVLEATSAAGAAATFAATATDAVGVTSLT